MGLEYLKTTSIPLLERIVFLNDKFEKDNQRHTIKSVFKCIDFIKTAIIYNYLDLPQDEIDSKEFEIATNLIHKIQESYRGELDNLFIENPILFKETLNIQVRDVDRRLTGLLSRDLKFDFNTNPIYSDFIFEIKFALNELAFFCPDVVIVNLLNEQEEVKSLSQKTKDKRRSEKAPNNKERVKALKTFCPELFSKLVKYGKETQGEVIHLITGVNMVDSYKYSFGSRQNQLKDVIIENMTELVNKINE